jgi:hypothetical protein
MLLSSDSKFKLIQRNQEVFNTVANKKKIEKVIKIR